MQTSVGVQTVGDPAELQTGAQFAHSILRLLLAVRYRKRLVAAVMVLATLLGGLYYATAPRRYAAKAALLITVSGHDQLDTSIASDELQRRNTMPTFENMAASAKVLESAIGRLPPADRIDLVDQSVETLITSLRANLAVKAIRSTNILELSYRSQDPQVAANVVRAVVQSYMDFMDDMHRGTAGEISRILTKEREEVAAKLNAKQEELLACRRQFADMGFRPDGKTLHPMVQRAVYFNDSLIAAQKQRVEYEALLATVRSAIATGGDLGQYVASVGDVLGREILLKSLGLSDHDAQVRTSLEQSLIAHRAELQRAQQNFGPTHPEIISLVEKIRLTEQYLTDAQQRINQRLTGIPNEQLGPWLVQIVEQKLAESRQKEQVLAVHFEQARSEAINLSGQMAQIELLERDVKRLGDMNDVLLNQIASLDLKQSGQDVRVAVIEEPVVATRPVSPRLRNVGMLTLLAGFGVSLAAVTLLDALDDRFRSAEELQNRLGLPLLAMVQRLQAPETVGIQALVAHAAPTSVASECFRTLRTALSLTHPDACRIVVTSTEPGDGKTTIMANLAVCYAQADKRTLLIDADLRRPGLTNLMGMRGPRGLSEVLRSDADITQIAPLHTRPSGLKGLDILPSGARPTDPAELLGGQRFSQLLAWAETAYDLILIDSPPALATTDAAIIGRLVDGVILVVQPAKNRRRLVTCVVERLGLMKLPVLGLVLNRPNSDKEAGYYGYHAYGYDYGYSPAGYGHDEQSSEDACLPFANESEDTEKDEYSALLIPRRVA